jgi:hypothetical protein
LFYFRWLSPGFLLDFRWISAGFPLGHKVVMDFRWMSAGFPQVDFRRGFLTDCFAFRVDRRSKSFINTRAGGGRKEEDGRKTMVY